MAQNGPLPFGPYIPGTVALVAYGVFMFVVARYRRIQGARAPR